MSQVGADAARYVAVAREGDLRPGSMKRVVADGRRIVLAHTGGRYFAFASRCTHRGAPLDLGTLAGTTLKCPWHKSCFDLVTGAPLAPPATKPIKTYPVKVSGGEVLVGLDD